MADHASQSFANHRKFVTLYHFVLFPLLVLFLLFRGWQVYRAPGLDTVADLIFVVAVIFTAFYARIFALQAQDRTIRLEERERAERLVAEELHGRFGELRRRHWVALRFASNDELEERVREVLDDPNCSGDDVKKKIRVWRADHFRL
ncbi:MAG: DUF6526 family protein [Acidobacteriota bacterium]